MTRIAIALLASLLLTACGGGGSSGPATPPPPSGPSAAEQLADDLQGLPLDDFYRASYGALLSRSPESVVWLTLTDDFPVDGDSLDDLSDAYQRMTIEMHGVVLDALRTYDRSVLSASEKLDYDVYEWFLQDNIDRLPFIYYNFAATYSLWGVQHNTLVFFTDIHPLATRNDAENYIARLTNVDRKLGQLEDHLERQRQAGIIEPGLSMTVAVNQVAAVHGTTPANSVFYTNFRDKIEAIADLSDADRSDLRSRALSAVRDDVLPAYRSLQSRLESLLANASPSIGVWQYPNGRDYYAYALRHRTSSDLTAAEIHQLGLDELSRINAEMRLLFDQLGYPQNESLQELFARVETDGGVIPARDVKSTYEGLIAFAEANYDQAFDIYPSAPVVVAEDPFGGYYIGPSFDGTRPGAFYAGTQVDQPWYQMPSLTYHESVPGHHTQIAIAMDQDMPAFRKIERVTGFVEGWALYAERLAWELGWYDTDIYGDLGRLQYEALRAARLVMDTGIHDLGWSFDRAVQFNIDNVGWSLGASQGAAARYSVSPGQASAYMIGMLTILRERQRAMDALGPAFDLRAFHRALLTNGGVPLTLLDDVVDGYIAEATP